MRCADGCYHLLYELQLTTTLRSAAELRAVEVIDASNGNTLLKLGPEDISRGEYLDTLDRKATETNSLGPFEGRVLLLNLSFDERPDLPPKVVHRFHISRNDPFTAQPAAFDFAPARLSSPRRASGSIAAARRRGLACLRWLLRADRATQISKTFSGRRKQ